MSKTCQIRASQHPTSSLKALFENTCTVSNIFFLGFNISSGATTRRKDGGARLPFIACSIVFFLRFLSHWPPHWSSSKPSANTRSPGLLSAGGTKGSTFSPLHAKKQGQNTDFLPYMKLNALTRQQLIACPLTAHLEWKGREREREREGERKRAGGERKREGGKEKKGGRDKKGGREKEKGRERKRVEEGREWCSRATNEIKSTHLSSWLVWGCRRGRLSCSSAVRHSNIALGHSPLFEGLEGKNFGEQLNSSINRQKLSCDPPASPTSIFSMYKESASGCCEVNICHLNKI